MLTIMHCEHTTLALVMSLKDNQDGKIISSTHKDDLESNHFEKYGRLPEEKSQSNSFKDKEKYWFNSSQGQECEKRWS